MLAYLLAHWRGKLSLSISFWVNTLGLYFIVSYAEWAILSALASPKVDLIKLTLISLLLTRLIIFPWQLIGLFRAIEHDFYEHKNILKTRGMQGLALLLVLFTLTYSLSLIQSAYFYKQQFTLFAQPALKTTYQLKVKLQQKQLTIEGDFDIGITHATEKILSKYPEIEHLVLNSKGGQIYEGRGLFKLITKYRLNTFVYEECSSACVTAFVGGLERNLGKQGKLGFHQYKFDASKTGLLIPFFNIKAEQQKDSKLFVSQGVKPTFVNKIFDQSSYEIWFPDHSELLDSNLIHHIILN